MELTNIQKLRIAVRVIKLLKENNHYKFYINNGDKTNMKIAKKAGIKVESYGMQAGYIDISEYISLTRDEMEMNLFKKINGIESRINRDSKEFTMLESVGKEIILKTKEFEDKSIPKSGYSKTIIGEMFRAIQYIQYRAHNDGDNWFIIGSPSFMSGMYLMSMIDELNWCSDSYNEETGQHKFEFTNEFLKSNSDGRISNFIEHSLALDADFIKYQLIDLLENGKVRDSKNEYDSRSFNIIR